MPRSVAKPLRRILFLLVSAVLAGSVRAEWVPLGRSDDFRVYLEQKMTARNGDLAQVWQLMDFTTAQWADAQTVVGSIRSLVEYDCAVARSRGLVSEAFSEQMGNGRLVATERLPDPPWEAVEVGSFSEKIRQLACAKK